MTLGPLILPFGKHVPRIARDAYVAPTACVIGDVEIGSRSSLWFGVVVRGDVHHVRIGARTNLQDATIVHVSRDLLPTHIGDDVTVGHGCILHACTLEDGAFVGIGSTVLDGAVVEGGAVVAAGSLVTPGKHVPRGELWAGRPARRLRALGPQDTFARAAKQYVELCEAYLRERESGS